MFVYLAPLVNLTSRLTSCMLRHCRQCLTCLFANFTEPHQDSSPYELQWSRTFAGIFSLRWAFGETRLYVSDPAALHHILVTKCYAYPKPDQLRALMSGALGQVS